jgi:Lon protease-like protein
MVVDCQSMNKPMGIVLPRQESEFMHEVPCTVGTMAEIHGLEKLDDGRYLFNAVGTKRFRIVSEHHDKPYLSALVEPYEDEAEPESGLKDLTQRAQRLFQEYLEILLEPESEQRVQTHAPKEPENLSYFIASLLQTIDDEQKQRFLEMTSTSLRLSEEVEILRREVPFMREILSRNIPEERTRLN